MTRILIAAKDRSWRLRVVTFLHAEGFSITEVSDFDVALQVANKNGFDLGLFDYDILEGDPFNLVFQWHKAHPEVPLVLMTPQAFPHLPTMLSKCGVRECLSKPISLATIRAAVSIIPSAVPSFINAGLNKTQVEQTSLQDEIIGKSEAILKVLEIVSKVADSDSTVLITGESGTGKELIARRIHNLSSRKLKSLVCVNCGALPESLLESELFGHEKGAFTGAIETREGRFAKAHQGTIFLDEIGDVSKTVQVKLLRVLQEKQLESVGSSVTKMVDVRILAATNKDLEQEVAVKRFREDLYWRLNVIPVRMPRLQERRSDIPLLIDHFVDLYNRKENRSITGFSPRALQMLLDYEWPGNVRELENLVERLVILKGKGEMVVDDLVPYIAVRGPSNENQMPATLSLQREGLKERMTQVEKSFLLQALEMAGWNKNKAAKMLGIKRTTLIEKLKRYHIHLQRLSSEETEHEV